MTVNKNIELKDFSTGKNNFSVDLQARAKKHLVFLHALHKLGIITLFLTESLLDDEVRKYQQTLKIFGVAATMDFRGDDRVFVGKSVRRYSELWLPLAAEAQRRNQDLIPPPDIAWMWHYHRLAPYWYSDHVKYLFCGDSVDASHPFVFQLEARCDDGSTTTSAAPAAMEKNSNETWPDGEHQDYAVIARATRDLFHELYPGESFFADSGGKTAAATTKSTTRFELSGFDVVAACQRQATFLWHVSSPKFSDNAFLREGIDNYLRFVKLTNHTKLCRFHRTNQMWLVPTYQIDCLWHTHILSNIQGYHTDVTRITGGGILDHDDSINDRLEGGVLDTSFQQTKELWKQVYSLEYYVQGGMHHGEPLVEFYRRDCFDPLSLRTKFVTNLAQSLGAINRDSEASSFSKTKNEWMPPNHPLAFIAERKTRSWHKNFLANPYKQGYVFGHGGE